MPGPGELYDPNERLRARLKWSLFSRVLLASCFLGALALPYLGSGTGRNAVSLSLLLLAIVVTYAMTIVSAVFLLRLERLLAFTCFQVAFDILLTTGVILVTGASESPFGFLYSIVVINAAILLGTPGAIGAAAGSSIAYATVVGLVAGRVLPQLDYPFRPPPLDLQFNLRFITTNATFFVIAMLASSLVRRLRHTEVLLEQREVERDRLSSLHEALARNIGSALVTTDVEGRVTSLNYVAEELAGTKAAEVLGREVGSVFPPLRHTTAGRIQFLQSSSSLQPTEFTHHTGDGRDMTLRCSTVSVRDTYQNPIGVLYILQDITALRPLAEQAEAADAVAEELSDTDDAPPNDGLIGNSPEMQQVRDFILKVARSDATLLVSGESGTGKELVARAVHARSPRADRPFVAINCGAIPAELMETELFGCAKGAYTGAVAARNGLFRTADGGTIFLDEVGELPLPLQVKLLRVLQERSFTPIGSDTGVTVDVRVVAATNRNLAREVMAGRFREDLFYRLNVLTIELPPLRQRPQDIPLLFRRFLRQFSELHGKRVQRLSVSAARRLQEHTYRGNVRELENIVEHAVALCDGETIHETHLPEYVLKQVTQSDAPPVASPSMDAVPFAPAPRLPIDTVRRPATEPALPAGNLDDDLAAYEKSIILQALSEAGGVKKRAADLLGINYRSFRHRLQKYGLADLSGVERR